MHHTCTWVVGGRLLHLIMHLADTRAALGALYIAAEVVPDFQLPSLALLGSCSKVGYARAMLQVQPQLRYQLVHLALLSRNIMQGILWR